MFLKLFSISLGAGACIYLWTMVVSLLKTINPATQNPGQGAFVIITVLVLLLVIRVIGD